VNPTTCPHCGADLPPGQIVTLCPECGKEVRAAAGPAAEQRPERACPKCNYLLQPFEETCPRCGAKPAKARAEGPFRPVAAEGEAEGETAPIGPPRVEETAQAPPGPPRLDGLAPAARPSDALRPLGGPAQAPPGPARPGGPPPPSDRRPPDDLQPMGGPARPAPRAGASDSPWGPAPDTGHGLPRSPQNTSGTHGAVPAAVKRWNWGAFFLHCIWGIAHNVWISLLWFVPVVSVVMVFVLGAKGSEWAWQNRRFASVEEFKGVQRVWGWVGLAVFLAGLIISLPIVAAVLVPMFLAAREAAEAARGAVPPTP